MELNKGQPTFPQDLVEWSGQHAGGVKRLFDPGSGRPVGNLLRTSLLTRLEGWVHALAMARPATPRVLLLVGGPGNGKTDAIEHTIKCLDEALGCGGRLVAELTAAFNREQEKVPRIVVADAGSVASPPRTLTLTIVQDASVVAGHEGRSAPSLLIDELTRAISGPDHDVYLCCVNRGVLDGALIHAIDHGLDGIRMMLETITRAVSLSSSAPVCWPLEGYSCAAVWPMDAESLMVPPTPDSRSPAADVLDHATNAELWPQDGSCPAGDQCPFCHSRRLLGRDDHKKALLQILRWYELASGKRLSFRDFFSLLSYLLAGHQHAVAGQKTSPCEWAAHLVRADQATQGSPNAPRKDLVAIFSLVSSSYQHALFHSWDAGALNILRRDMKDLGLPSNDEGTRVLKGLVAFLDERKGNYLPTTISSMVADIAKTLDPGVAAPDMEVALSKQTIIRLSEIDVRFSRSVGAGLEYLRKYHVFSASEVDLLRRLAAADTLLSSPSIRRKRPAAASRIQHLIRDFACRLARRSICTRSAKVANSSILEAFQIVVDDDQGRHVHEVAQKVRQLLNSKGEFQIPLTTTFGQPLPPAQRQATLVVPQQHVRPMPTTKAGRPRSPLCFLQIGKSSGSPPLALTYELYKAIRELERGLSPASLPRTVMALLDTARARLAGHIVRDTDMLENSAIKVGREGTTIRLAWGGQFASSKEEIIR